MAKYLDPAADDDPKAVEAQLEALLDFVQPGWREVFVTRRFLPRMVVTHAAPTAAMRGLAGRPSCKVDAMDGVYIAGDWVGAEGMFADAVLASAQSAATAHHAAQCRLPHGVVKQGLQEVQEPDRMQSEDSPVPDYDQVYQKNRKLLWGLCYRMTGSASDADDIVQDTFVRALERPPAGNQDSWRPWLVKVAMNLSRDHLRRRQERPYVGPWLPSPIDTGEEHSPPAVETALTGESTEARYEMLESLSFAFLLTLEALTPAQRAVLLLRDVFDYSVRDTAVALDMREPNVKTTHHRAREAMQAYDRSRRIPTRELQVRTLEQMSKFISALSEQDVPRAEALLAAEVRALSDGGGEFRAALKPVTGRDRVLRLLGKISARRDVADVEWRMFNGFPALVVYFADRREKEAPLVVVRCDLADDGKIAEIHILLAREKLTAVRP